MFLFLLLSVSGCRDRYDVDELAIVIGVGIDQVKGAEPILLTVQVVNPAATKSPGTEGGGGSGGQNKPFIILTSQGKTVLEAVRNLTRTSPRKLLFSHNKIIVLGKTLAESDIAEVMDYIERDREFRRTNLVVVAEQTAKEILETKTDIEMLPALGLFTTLTGKSQEFVYPVNLNEFLLNLQNGIGVSYAPLVNLKDLNQESNRQLEQAAGKPMPTSTAKSPAKIDLDGMAVFRHNRLIGTLNDKESRDLLWLTNKLQRDMVTVPALTAKGDGEIAVDITKGNSEIIPHFTNHGITMDIICTGNATLRETGSFSPQLKDLQQYNQIEQKTEELLQARMEQTVNRAQQELKADYLGFGNQIHNYNPPVWHRLQNDWDQTFPQIPYRVTFHITLLRAGTIRGSAIPENAGSEL
ncbi:spore germination gerac [Lucifera butyrica]|uniref:Spore germination gerac n=1 Tax=Lucifera butyrica TaxID=1351585 RepID=A0A498R126_9FIRM|nr:Ger(x)C family spore germination protein [Lucifera butyrica]VBB05144.1 spore germination gerac [Lucifera butyrica]